MGFGFYDDRGGRRHSRVRDVNDFHAAVRKAEDVFRRHGGVLRAAQAIALGVHPRTLYHMRNFAFVDELSRGVYRLASLPAMKNVDLLTVAARVPRATVCLISALWYHRLTTTFPGEVQIALPRGAKSPVLDEPPIRVFRFSGRGLTDGVQVVHFDNIAVRVYEPGKTIADCFRFRNKIGIDIAIEGLELALQSRRATPDMLLKHARAGRVESVMAPYLRARG
jgi:predicted transcriptional regulator of viral defense system